MIPALEAWQRLCPHLRPLPEVSTPRRAAAGRVLARALTARCDVPFADVSAMDGYALGGDPASGRRLPVVATVAAGDPPGLQIPPGTAARIMTGAPVPTGADRVVPVEGTDGGEDLVLLHRPGAPGDHVRRQGEVLRRGNELLPSGSALTPAALGVAAGHGYDELPLVGAPRVALLVTGDEVVAPEVEPAPGQLRDSHSALLQAALASLSLQGEALGIAPDRADVLREAIERGLDADVLLITGGVSRGAFDLVEGVLEEVGCKALFDSVAVQPGKPLVAAVRADADSSSGRQTLVFGLPGNPGSVAVCFWLFVRPALRRLMGHDDGYWHNPLAARLTAPLPAAKERDRFLPARLHVASGALEAEPLIPRGSHDLIAWALGNALVRIPTGSPSRLPGTSCEVLPICPWG